MDVERTIEFILDLHAKNEAGMAELRGGIAELRESQKAADQRVERLTRNVTRLARLGLRTRSRLNDRDAEHAKRLPEHEQWLEEQKLLMHEIGEKLNALIDVVDRWPRQRS